VPALRDPPLLTMGDMGMNHGNGMDHGSMDHGSMDHGSGSMSMQGMKMRDTTLLPPDVKVGPGIDMVSMAPVDKMGDPGLGLRDVPHRVLNYRMLAAAEPNPEARVPTRLLELHLTGNMERYMWSFDGRMYSAVSDVPIRFAWNERVRVKLVNNTMMAHPIHLHGLFFEMVNGQSAALQPRKNTMIVQPGASAQFDLTANEPGDWAFHCHLLYHMHGGMMQTVTVAGPERAA
jgi:FtsP/CotA-like multicopper oxidase with cupredoxin domain